MTPADKEQAKRFHEVLIDFAERDEPLPGIQDGEARDCFVRQLVESTRRVRYVTRMRSRKLDERRADPTSEMFDPVLAAIVLHNRGEIDEAFWLIFLSVHFGRNIKTKWRLARDVYGELGSGNSWTWQRIIAAPDGFRAWLSGAEGTLRGGDGIKRAFGNHRKYEGLAGTPSAAESYVAWVNGAHEPFFEGVLDDAGGDPRRAFDSLYNSMDAVHRFGRMAKFDYLTMVAKVGLAPIEAGSAYIASSTGPLEGARLLFQGGGAPKLSPSRIDELVVKLGDRLGVGMQEMEDAICNWQKSPTSFVAFRG